MRLRLMGTNTITGAGVFAGFIVRYLDEKVGFISTVVQFVPKVVFMLSGFLRSSFAMACMSMTMTIVMILAYTCF